MADSQLRSGDEPGQTSVDCESRRVAGQRGCSPSALNETGIFGGSGLIHCLWEMAAVQFRLRNLLL